LSALFCENFLRFEQALHDAMTARGWLQSFASGLATDGYLHSRDIRRQDLLAQSAGQQAT